MRQACAHAPPKVRRSTPSKTIQSFSGRSAARSARTRTIVRSPARVAQRVGPEVEALTLQQPVALDEPAHAAVSARRRRAARVEHVLYVRHALGASGAGDRRDELGAAESALRRQVRRTGGDGGIGDVEPVSLDHVEATIDPGWPPSDQPRV